MIITQEEYAAVIKRMETYPENSGSTWFPDLNDSVANTSPTERLCNG